MKRAKDNLGIQKPTVLGVRPGGREGENKKVETFRIDYLIRTPKVEKLSLQPISFWLSGSHRLLPFKRLFCNRFFLLYTLGGGSCGGAEEEGSSVRGLFWNCMAEFAAGRF